MTPEQGGSRFDRNVRLYPWYALTFNTYFWMPVFILYFLQHMPLSQVLRLEAVYYAGVVLLEVPSGYFSDRVGRRATLILACLSLIAAYILFFLGSTFAVFAAAQLLLAAGLAFNSGTDTSLHYDSLASMGRESEYDQREALAARNALLASGLGGIVGGLAAVVDLRAAYLLSALGAAASLAIVLAMREPRTHEKTLVPAGPVRQARICVSLLRHRVLGWVFGYAVVMTVLNHVPYEFYQPYIDLILERVGASAEQSPAVSGLHMGAVMVLASFVAGASIRMRDRLGLVPTLMLAAGLQTFVIASMGLLLHPVVLLVVLLRSIPRALSAAPINAAIAPVVGKAQRATYLSIQSLTGRLAFAGFLVILSWVAGSEGGDGDWQSISAKLVVSAGFGLTALLSVWVFRPRRAGSNYQRDDSA